MKAIKTSILPATDHRPTRIKAWANGVKPLIMSKTRLERGEDISDKAVHREAATRLANRCNLTATGGWEGPLIGGSLGDGEWVWVFLPLNSYEICY